MSVLQLDRPRQVMTPQEVLHELDRLGIRYKLQGGVFVTAASLNLGETKHNLPGLKFAIAEHADALADLVHTHQPIKCEWCKMPVKSGQRYVCVYLQEEGRRITLHQECQGDRSEALPDLPVPDILIDEPGYTVLIEDSGLCCYCQMAEAELPTESPNVCVRCWRILDAKREADRR